MKLATFALSVLIPVNAFALYCPGNDTLLTPDMSIQEVITICGKPASTNTYTRTFSISETWTYQKSNPRYNIKVTMLFNHGRVDKINVTHTPKPETCSGDTHSCHPVTSEKSSYNGCKQLILTGDTARFVRRICGEPDVIDTHESLSSEYTELLYPGHEPDMLLFKNGKLIRMYTDLRHPVKED